MVAGAAAADVRGERYYPHGYCGYGLQNTAPAVVEAIQRRAARETYGYGYPAPKYLQECADWQKHRNHWNVKPEWIVYTPGVNMALVCAIEMYTQPGDNVIIQSPVYYPYYDYVRGTGRNMALNALVNREGYYEMNFAELEALAKMPETKLMLLCNPHNPVGRAWTKENAEYIAAFIVERMPQVKYHIPEAAYLAWLDFRALGMSDEALWHFMRHEAKVATDNGVMFGLNGEGRGFQRLNFACPRSQLSEALNRIADALDTQFLYNN